MDLAFIAKRLDLVGGTEWDLVQLVNGLAARGHRITVYCSHPASTVSVACRMQTVLSWARTGAAVGSARCIAECYSFEACMLRTEALFQ